MTPSDAAQTATDSPGLTETDLKTLGNLAEYDLRRGDGSYHALPEPSFEDGRGLTTAQCNAIRAAAEDGKTYREIADLFAFLSDPTAANRHATGECPHGAGDYPPVESQREPGPVNPVDELECSRLRNNYESGMVMHDLSDEYERAVSTVRRHVSGECSHD